MKSSNQCVIMSRKLVCVLDFDWLRNQIAVSREVHCSDRSLLRGPTVCITNVPMF